MWRVLDRLVQMDTRSRLLFGLGIYIVGEGEQSFDHDHEHALVERCQQTFRDAMGGR